MALKVRTIKIADGPHRGQTVIFNGENSIHQKELYVKKENNPSVLYHCKTWLFSLDRNVFLAEIRLIKNFISKSELSDLSRGEYPPPLSDLKSIPPARAAAWIHAIKLEIIL